METRFPNCATDTLIYSVAHLLDPQYRGAILKSYRDVYDKAMEEIIWLGSNKLGTNSDETEPTAEVGTDSEDISAEDLTPAERLLLEQETNTPNEPGNIPTQPSDLRKELDEDMRCETQRLPT